MTHVAIVTMLALGACATHTHITLDTLETVEAVEMKPSSLPADPLNGPPATRVWLVLADGSRRGIMPGRINRTPDSVIAWPVDAAVTSYPLDKVRMAVFENVSRIETGRQVAREEKVDGGLAAGWAVGIGLCVGFIVLLAATGSSLAGI